MYVQYPMYYCLNNSLFSVLRFDQCSFCLFFIYLFVCKSLKQQTVNVGIVLMLLLYTNTYTLGAKDTKQTRKF